MSRTRHTRKANHKATEVIEDTNLNSIQHGQIYLYRNGGR
jgi:hypothetical protein